MIPTTLVTGGSPAQREQAIAKVLDRAQPTALILEGLGSGNGSLVPDGSLQVARIAAGCPCCEGNLVLRVSLNRLLRTKPARLFIGLASDAHLETLRAFLARPPYSELLILTKELGAGAVHVDNGSAHQPAHR